MKWLWRVWNRGFPDGHEDSSNQWGPWQLVSAKDAVRIEKGDSLKRYEFVAYLPASPSSAEEKRRYL